MSTLRLQVALIVSLFVVAGCATVKDDGSQDMGWFGTDSTLRTLDKQKSAAGKVQPSVKYAATLQVSRYEDQRKQVSPRLLGTSTEIIRGISGSQLLLDQDVSDLVTTAMKMQFATEGYRLVEAGGPGNGMFEVSGKIKDLTLDVKYRDEINIVIETTVKDMRDGTIVWSGMVTEKHDRFAGVSGNNKDDVVAYLDKELGIATTKTIAAVSTSLMSAYPALFSLTGDMQEIPGVSIYAVPAIANPLPANTSASMPSAEAQAGSTASPAEKQAPKSAGLLLVNTNPARAKIYVDGVYFGLSPLRVEVEPGIHAVEVKLKSYQTVTEKVSLRKGETTEMELTLER